GRPPLRLALDPRGGSPPPPHLLSRPSGRGHLRPAGRAVPRLPPGGRHALLADLSPRADRLRRLPLSVLLGLRRQPLPDRPGGLRAAGPAQSRGDRPAAEARRPAGGLRRPLPTQVAAAAPGLRALR